jgi:malate dehydrogenase (oxaloacetate-decarboxylating)
MLNFEIKTGDDEQEYIETSIHGKALLTIPQLNKGTAFTESERHEFGLTGKLPNRVETLNEQVQRAYWQYRSYDELMNRNIYLNAILNTNQVLFYRLVKDHIKEMLPTIYTPIVGSAVKAYNKKFIQPRGLYITCDDQDRIDEILDNRSNPNIDLIVVSDGEGVLGIGDQGVGAMAIPVAKLMVYTAFAGINPLNTLPIMLDAGTNNEDLLNDPLYLGCRHTRLSGPEYNQFIDKFIAAIKRKFPHVFLHWEDFGRTNAYRHLLAYQNDTCTFNDDIQGTGVVATAAVLATTRHTGIDIKDQRIVIFGAGTAGMGVTDSLYKAMLRSGLSEEEAQSCFWLIDRQGLLTQNVKEITDAQTPFIRTSTEIQSWSLQDANKISLLEVVQNIKPTILIGCSAMAGAFTEEVVKAMAKHVERPTIFPLSNPTEKVEAVPEDILRWTDGKALLATGSPFADVTYNDTVYPVSQCNNYLAFPGIGLGLIAIKATRLTDNMLWKASEALGKFNREDAYRLLPSIQQAGQASRAMAIAIAQAAIDEGYAGIETAEPLGQVIDHHMWEPHYLPYEKTK